MVTYLEAIYFLSLYVFIASQELTALEDELPDSKPSVLILFCIAFQSFKKEVLSVHTGLNN